MKTNFYINNEQIKEPNNWAELGIELNFDKDEPNAAVSINRWDMGVGANNSKDSAKKSLAHIIGGLSGGVGVFEGAPFRIELEDAGQRLDLFKGYLDFTTAQIDCELVSVDAIEEGGIDWLNANADSVTFEYLYEETNLLNSSDFVAVPYVINSIPKTGEAFMMTLTAFVVIQTVKQEVEALQEMSIETSNPISAIAGILKIALRVIYIATLLVTIVKLILDALNLIIQPVKYHKGMFVKDLCEIGAKHFGMTFKSSILQTAPFNKLFILPNQYDLEEDNNNGLLGFLKPKPEQLGYYSGTYGDLLRTLKVMFNAKLIVQNGVIQLERRDYNPNIPTYELPNIEKNSYRLNTNDFISNIYIEFLTDLNDKNTINRYDGTACQITTLPKKIINKGMVLSKGYNRRSVPFALGKVKTELTAPENILKFLAKGFDPVVGVLVKLINKIIDLVNGIIKAIKKLIRAINLLPRVNIEFDPKPIKKIKYTPLADLIENRKGMLILENDLVSSPKIFLLDQRANDRYNKPSSNNSSVVNATYLWKNYHYIDSFDRVVYPNTNQYKIYEVENVPFCFEDYLKVRQNNRIFDNGKTGVIDSLSWNIFEQTANIRYRINEIYTNNLYTKVIDSKKSNPFI